jgi:hypothetical protein
VPQVCTVPPGRPNRLGSIMNRKLTTVAAAAAVVAAGGYLRYSCKAVAFAYRIGQTSANLDYSRDVRVLGVGLADAVGMLKDAGIWHPESAEPAPEETPAALRARACRRPPG